MVFTDVDGPPIHHEINRLNAHFHVPSFIALPKIDEVEDGGTPWPAFGKLGLETFTSSMPLIMLEDDDSSGPPSPGKYQLCELASGALASQNGLSLKTLPIDETSRQLIWRWSDKSPLPSDANDTEYWYEMEFLLSHEHPCSSHPKLAGCS